jgi:hypothetical protein
MTRTYMLRHRTRTFCGCFRLLLSRVAEITSVRVHACDVFRCGKWCKHLEFSVCKFLTPGLSVPASYTTDVVVSRVYVYEKQKTPASVDKKSPSTSQACLPSF